MWLRFPEEDLVPFSIDVLVKMLLLREDHGRPSVGHALAAAEAVFVGFGGLRQAPMLT